MRTRRRDNFLLSGAVVPIGAVLARFDLGSLAPKTNVATAALIITFIMCCVVQSSIWRNLEVHLQIRSTILLSSMD